MPLVSISQVTSRPVPWLWNGRIPLGAITLLDGDAGTRKSNLALSLAAAVSVGSPLPGHADPVRGGVLLLGEEDGYADTVRPRLEQMGADIDRIFFFRDEAITLAYDLHRIEVEVVHHGVKLIVLDPLSGFLGTNSGREQDVRRVLMRVRQMAERNGVAVLAIRHLTKTRTSVLHSGVGSVGIAAVARSGLLIAPDPSDSSGSVLAQFKCNSGPISPSILIRFDGVRAQFGEASSLQAADLACPTSPNNGSLLAEAVEVLRDALSLGAVRHQRVRKLATDAGVAYRTLRKAKDILGVESKKLQDSFGGPWYWRLPGDERQAPPYEGDDEDLTGSFSFFASAPPATSGNEAEEPSPRAAAKKHKAPEPDPEQELAKLVGLRAVKESVSQLRGLMKMAAQRAKANLPQLNVSFHAVFVGNPGTGKTTVARLYGRILRKFGRLKKGHLVEVDRGKLIGEYVGHTAQKTRAALESALGGVLFIDEAYALCTDPGETFGRECVETIIKYMEDHREEIVVILAGYPREMDRLLESNPGFKSRVAQRLVFENYDDDSLREIFRLMLQAGSYKVAPCTEDAVVQRLRLERDSDGGTFGNGRAVRNIFEEGVRRQGARLGAISGSQQLPREQLQLLEPEDLTDRGTGHGADAAPPTEGAPTEEGHLRRDGSHDS